MAAKTAGNFVPHSELGIAALTNVDATAAYELGKRVNARDLGSTAYGWGEFIYLNGATSIARGSVVTYTGAFVAVLVAADQGGGVAVALSAVDTATKGGWFQIKGKGVVKCDSGITDGAQLYIDGTAGRIDDTVVTGDEVIGMVAASTDDTNTCLVNMQGNCYVGNTNA